MHVLRLGSFITQYYFFNQTRLLQRAPSATATKLRASLVTQEAESRQNLGGAFLKIQIVMGPQSAIAYPLASLDVS